MHRSIVLLLALALSACDRAPSADNLPTWQATDHDRLADQAAARRAPAAPRPRQETTAATGGLDAGAASSASAPSAAPTEAQSAEALAEVAWNNLCSTCHGPGGRGDGPQAPMVSPPNFTDKAWLASRSDAELALAITQGKNKMPKFSLPDRTVAALVRQIRGFSR